MTTRLWSRDERIGRVIERSPLLCDQIARFLGNPPKKIGERLCLLHRAEHVNRIPFFQPDKQGNAKFLYYKGNKPTVSTLRHTVMIGELMVQSNSSFPRGSEYEAEFFYGNEVTISDLRPDGMLLVKRARDGKIVCHFLEADTGSEKISSPSSYSLFSKLGAYRTYYDSQRIEREFFWAGKLRGFWVLLVLTSYGRLGNVQRLLTAEGLDFVLLTTMQDIESSGLTAKIWRTHDGRLVNLFGKEHV